MMQNYNKPTAIAMEKTHIILEIVDAELKGGKDRCLVIRHALILVGALRCAYLDTCMAP